MKRKVQLIVLVAGIVLVSYISWWGYHVTHYSEWVSHISIGDSKEKVLAVVGHPVMTNSTPDYLWCRETETAYEYMYGTSVVASWSVIGFNKDGKVVCKQELQSP